MKLTAKQTSDLRTAYVCAKANGILSYSLHGSYVRVLAAKGLAESFLGRSTNGGNMARHYRLTTAGLDLAKTLFGDL